MITARIDGFRAGLLLLLEHQDQAAMSRSTAPTIDPPPTALLQRPTVTSALNCSTQWTNFAVARAWKPLAVDDGQFAGDGPLGGRGVGRAVAGADVVRFWSFPTQDLAGDINIFASSLRRLTHRLFERGFVAHRGELDQHRQIDAGHHFDMTPFITEIARLEGVPPNMSVRTTTPEPELT